LHGSLLPGSLLLHLLVPVSSSGGLLQLLVQHCHLLLLVAASAAALLLSQKLIGSLQSCQLLLQCSVVCSCSSCRSGQHLQL
jgi:hypothetical protein